MAHACTVSGMGVRGGGGGTGPSLPATPRPAGQSGNHAQRRGGARHPSRRGVAYTRPAFHATPRCTQESHPCASWVSELARFGAETASRWAPLAQLRGRNQGRGRLFFAPRAPSAPANPEGDLSDLAPVGAKTDGEQVGAPRCKLVHAPGPGSGRGHAPSTQRAPPACGA